MYSALPDNIKEQLTQEIKEDKKRLEKATSTIENLKTSKDKNEIIKTKLALKLKTLTKELTEANDNIIEKEYKVSFIKSNMIFKCRLLGKYFIFLVLITM